jgi:hypothetical protein
MSSERLAPKDSGSSLQKFVERDDHILLDAVNRSLVQLVHGAMVTDPEPHAYVVYAWSTV